MFQIPDYVNAILEKLNASGFEAYLAGGCVRDFLMGKTPADFDITTSAEPNETKECFSDYTIIETGIKHGTVTVVTKGGNVEITTYRIDGEYKDSRHPEKVTFSKNLKDDLKRRDFTVNAMAYNFKDGLVDLYRGREHIDKKIICCVGEADKRFSEDSLRILRGLRFASVLNFKIEEKTSESIIKNREMLCNISVERIFVELKKLICGDNVSRILIKYRSVIEIVIPDFKNISKEQYELLSLGLNKCEKDVNLRLTLFLSAFEAEKAAAVLRELKSDSKTVSFVKNTLNALPYEIKAEKAEIKRFLKENSYEIFKAVIKIKNITENKETEKISSMAEEIIKNNECFSLKQMKVDGRDLINNFGLSGSVIGETLEKLLEDVIDGKVKNEKSELISRILEKI